MLRAAAAARPALLRAAAPARWATAPGSTARPRSAALEQAHARSRRDIPAVLKKLPTLPALRPPAAPASASRRRAISIAAASGVAPVGVGVVEDRRAVVSRDAAHALLGAAAS